MKTVSQAGALEGEIRVKVRVRVSPASTSVPEGTV
jgi:hypothetical protein